MGKTAKGAVWLDPVRTTPYEYYQYWINTDDQDVERFLALFTLLPMDEIREIHTLKDADLNNAKSVLAFETTLLAHGREEAIKAYHGAQRMFGPRVVPKEILPSSSIPCTGIVSVLTSIRAEATGTSDSIPYSNIDEDQLKAGIPAFKLFHMVGLTNSGGAARRLIEQGGAYINGSRVESFDSLITNNNVKDMEILLRAGKKRFHKIIMEKKR
jgi:tyrosyl-tRNA synthetase